MAAKKAATKKPTKKTTKVPTKKSTKSAKSKAKEPAGLKTRPNRASVDAFLATVDTSRRQDCKTLVELFSKATGHPPVMWGSSIIGFDQYHYKYGSGREADWLATGFSPRKQNLTIYIMPGFDRYPELMKKLGTFTTGKSCLYVKTLSQIDLTVLKELINRSVADIKKLFPSE